MYVDLPCLDIPRRSFDKKPDAVVGQKCDNESASTSQQPHPSPRSRLSVRVPKLASSTLVEWLVLLKDTCTIVQIAKARVQSNRRSVLAQTGARLPGISQCPVLRSKLDTTR